MKIATWNLDHASNSSRPISAQIEQIKSIDADVWVLTETSEKVDLHELGYVCVTPHTKNQYKKYWSTIWTRWQIKAQIDCYDNETAVCALIQSPTGDLYAVYGTIITWKNDPGKVEGQRSPPWAEHDKSIAEHGADWKRIRDLYPGIPFIVAGDFNQTRDGASRGYHSPNGISLLNDELAKNDLECITDDDFGLKGELKSDPRNHDLYRHNVDHICISRSGFGKQKVGVWDHFNGTTYWSDHNGVFAELIPK